MAVDDRIKVLSSAFDSPTYGQDVSFALDKPVGSASISPCGRDIVLASRQGLHIIELDSPYSPPRYLSHHTPWEVADVQWSPFSSRDSWVVSTSNQKALLWNLEMADTRSSIEHVLHGHTRAITDINFSAHHPDIIATCAVDSFVHCWDFRRPRKPAITFCDWFAGATQVKWNRQDSHVLASSHNKFLHIWDDRKGAYPLRSIEAHSTKIYGVDWDRTETRQLATCSLDRTIKFWDYTDSTDEAKHTIHTPFPVWRARYTPFGTGLLAMPQREDNNLHLYDRRALTSSKPQAMGIPVHSFEGHENQVKEFLWRPRGTITEAADNREFQLVSWGADRVLRLHRLGEDILRSVDYERGQQPKAHLKFTRKNAVYKTFREDPPKSDIGHPDNMGSRSFTGTHGRPGRSGMSQGLLTGRNPFNIRGQAPAVNRTHLSQDMDPISWMKGVKIGKRGYASGPMHRSLPSVLSPSPRADRVWEKSESLGEELTQIGEKLSKVTFEEIDMLNRRLLLALSGPWGPDQKSTWFKCRIKFPDDYPDAARPTLSFEESHSLANERVASMLDEISQISMACQQQQLSSLEAIILYLLGERSLNDSLLLIESQRSHNLEAIQTSAASSSDEDDDDSHVQAMDVSQSPLATFNTQYNVPLPKACGALWADDGRLVCFFPHKEEKSPSTVDSLSVKASERSARSIRTVFESFAQFNKIPEHAKYRRAMSGIIDSDSDSSGYSSVSTSSSSLEDMNVTKQMFLPSIAFPEASLQKHNEITMDGSQWSSGDTGHKQTISPHYNYVSLHNCQDLLPSRPDLAREYVLSANRHYTCTYNARIAEEANLHDLAEMWSLVDLVVSMEEPLDTTQVSNPSQSAVAAARISAHPIRTEDSAIDLSFDFDQEAADKDELGSGIWGHHPFGQQWLVEELFTYFESLADIQVLAMLSCILSNPGGTISRGQRKHHQMGGQSMRGITNQSQGVSPSLVDHIAGLGDTNLKTSPVRVRDRRKPKKSDEATAAIALPIKERVIQQSAITTPMMSFRQSRTRSDVNESDTMTLSTSPEQLRHIPRSSSNLASAFAASLSRPFSFSASASSSPPSHPRKRLSPVGSYNGGPLSGFGSGGTGLLSRSTNITYPRLAYPFTASDAEEATRLSRSPTFQTKLKNQDQFDLDGYADIPLLAASDEWRYHAYREAYAGMLLTWELPIQNREILNYNSPWKADHNGLNSQTSDLPLQVDNLPRSNGLEFKDICRECTTTINPTPADQLCPSCSTRKSLLQCLFCTSIIRGLASPCLSCGHVLHPSCRTFLQSRFPPYSDGPSTDAPYRCISGCDCECSSYTSVELPEPELPVERKNSGDTETIIGGEHETAPGWRDELQAPRYEVAYESLARNLSGGVRQALTPRSSQIWRGGEEWGRDRKRSMGSGLRREESLGG